VPAPRVTLDTMAVVQHLLRRREPTVVDYWIEHGLFEIVCSEALLAEWERKLLDPRVRRQAAKYDIRWSEEQVADFLRLCRITAVEMVVPTPVPNAGLQAGDATVLGTALAGKVDALGSWDNDFHKNAVVVEILGKAGIRLLTTDEMMRWIRSLL